MLSAVIYGFVGLFNCPGWANAEPITYAALGDSYASGDGAGSSRLLPNFDVLCGRFSDAYPVQIAKDAGAGVERLKNLACGGAVTISVLNTQVPFAINSDLITIQVGGNEIDFFVLVNECIYQWRPFSSCDAEIARARRLVQSQMFLDNFDNLVSRTLQATHDDTLVMVLGYARFFNDEADQCDQVSFSHTNGDNFLTKPLRRQLNDIVTLLNDVIKAATEAHGAYYIDVDQLFSGHRFCEDGAIEPINSSSWFYSDGNGTQDRSSMRLDLRTTAQILLPNPFKQFLNFTRTFHPTNQGHAAIAQEVVRMLKRARSSEELQNNLN